ncbi:MAG: prepilin-type N-terminal cleavage/methylation domain-containing protein [Kiritimatiellae bacterium]|nr:prepilin-type N-terminal cleavage/methylation domain-containing protein [Kiritimatiellia bacterium]
MLFRKKHGFTLVELLVVISILGILAAALTTQFTKARSMGQSIRCKANLKNLTQAAINYGVEKEYMPHAGSYEFPWPATENGRYKTFYHEYVGWVSWTGTGRWRSEDPQSGAMNDAVAYGANAFESITNGVLWSRVGKDLSVYVCDAHKAEWDTVKSKKPLRSYVMNGYFGYQINGKGKMSPWRWVRMDDLAAGGNAGNLLLFAELPPMQNNGGNSEQTTIDSVLENTRGYGGVAGKQEILGFYHKVGKRSVAHVAFADGHVDVLIQPQDASAAELKRLTEQLCNGEEIESDLRKKMR